MTENGSAAPSRRAAVRRLPDRARYDAATIHAILDEGLYCHVGFVDPSDGQPFVIPCTYARDGARVLLHGSAASRMIKALAAGAPACVTVTLLDGLVLARSGFHHSMNYRSVVVLGRAAEVTDPGEKRRALDMIVEHVAPGRPAEVRPATEAELRGTRVVAIGLDEASAKVRTGPPKDDESDLALDCWAGELPLRLVPQPPVPDPALRPGLAPTATVTAWRRPGAKPDLSR
jgi:nitroimidazol reductase NimA-like FMN-containing flavoprotein (pyridoxamine 5'-phosphate oxidase superfamily)